MKKKTSISLIGFMATGKSTVGKLLAKKLNYNFIETDKLIIEKTGKSITKIFDEDGEKNFRLHEQEICKKISKYKNTVISCGGGIILEKKNIANLKKNSIVILLKANLNEIYQRISADKKNTRPIIDKKDKFDAIKTNLNFRKPLYEEAADLKINTSKKSIEDITEEIIQKLNNMKKNV